MKQQHKVFPLLLKLITIQRTLKDLENDSNQTAIWSSHYAALGENENNISKKGLHRQKLGKLRSAKENMLHILGISKQVPPFEGTKSVAGKIKIYSNNRANFDRGPAASCLYPISTHMDLIQLVDNIHHKSQASHLNPSPALWNSNDLISMPSCTTLSLSLPSIHTI